MDRKPGKEEITFGLLLAMEVGSDKGAKSVLTAIIEEAEKKGSETVSVGRLRSLSAIFSIKLLKKERALERLIKKLKEKKNKDSEDVI